MSSAVRREWKFDRSDGSWTINERLFDLKTVAATVKKGSTEIWSLENDSGSWSHPIHIHFEEFQILSLNDSAAAAVDSGRRDVVILRPNGKAQIFFRFRDFSGKFVMHCHNVVHEDHAMMIRFDIV